MPKPPQRPQKRSAFPAKSPRQSPAIKGGLQQQVLQMQEEMMRAQESLKDETVTVTVGGGVVVVVATGNQEIQSITIAPEAIDPDDVEILQDMILAAVNEALVKSKDMAEQRMSALTGGLSIPGLI